MKMKKWLTIGIGAAVAAAGAAVGGVLKLRKNRQKQGPEKVTFDETPESIIVQKKYINYHDAEHLILCPESHLERRIYKMETTINMRDLGGYTGLDGRKTRWGKIIRSEDLSKLSDNDVHALETIGVRHVYDFRDAKRTVSSPDRMPNTADYTNLEVLTGLDVDHHQLNLTDPDQVDYFFKKVYGFQVANKAKEFAVVLHAIADDELPVLFHCTNGKDRTGFMAALILLVCGVPEETIISDYTLTNLTFDEAVETLGTVFAQDIPGVSKYDIRDFFGVRPAWLKLQLDYIRENYGHVDAYLLDQTDLTAEDLRRIRENLLEEVA